MLDTGSYAIAAFVESMSIAFRAMAGIEATVRAAKQTTGRDGISGVTALLRLSAHCDGYFVLSITNPVAMALTRKILEGRAEPDEQMTLDCVREVTNVIAGQAKTMLVGTNRHFTFSTPVAVISLPDVLDAECWVCECTCEFGDFNMQVWLPS